MKQQHPFPSHGRARRLCTTVVTIVLCLQPHLTQAQQQEAITAGEKVFIKYCATCHGQEGRGDGPVAQLLRIQPTNLTELSKRRNGTFPFWDMYRVIDGRQTIKAHGPHDMPVWGRTFTYERDRQGPYVETHVRGRIFELLFYLESIQQP